MDPEVTTTTYLQLTYSCSSSARSRQPQRKPHHHQRWTIPKTAAIRRVRKEQ